MSIQSNQTTFAEVKNDIDSIILLKKDLEPLAVISNNNVVEEVTDIIPVNVEKKKKKKKPNVCVTPLTARYSRRSSKLIRKKYKF